ncbi:ABC transporter ATP-binding protein [Methylocapsa sp. S129]|uniref:ABC transporter ATP-binding protein n=1 Tax=Methylocapsa sp. S129 TaxID=1641869 RepID=UPI00352A19D2
MVGVDVVSIVKDYGPARVLDGVSAAFEPGRFTSLLGPSGSGKTTLLRIIAGFVTPNAGTVSFGGVDVTGEPVWKRNVGMVFQSYALFPHMSVRDNIRFGLDRRGVRGEVANREVNRVLELVHLEGFDQRRPKELSGGQQQRVALARAIVTKPRVLLLDEPLSALDRRLRQGMQVELRRIQRESGLTTIFVTHDQEEALTLSDEVAILDRGRIVQHGSPTDIYERPRTRFAASFLGDANFFTGQVNAGAIEIGPYRLSTQDSLPAQGSAVTFAVRPEKMNFQAPRDGARPMNRFGATLREIIYAGATSTFLLADDSGSELKVFLQNRDMAWPSIGARVELSWSPSDTILVSE